MHRQQVLLLLTWAIWSKRPKRSFKVLTKSLAVREDESGVKFTMSAKSMVTFVCRCTWSSWKRVADVDAWPPARWQASAIFSMMLRLTCIQKHIRTRTYTHAHYNDNSKSEHLPSFAHLGGYVGGYHAQKQLLLLLALALELDALLDASACSIHGAIVGGIRHDAIIKTGNGCASQHNNLAKELRGPGRERNEWAMRVKRGHAKNCWIIESIGRTRSRTNNAPPQTPNRNSQHTIVSQLINSATMPCDGHGISEWASHWTKNGEGGNGVTGWTATARQIVLRKTSHEKN